MKAFLMHADRDFDLDRALPPNERDVVQDLGLAALLDAMALGDPFLAGVARKAVLSSLWDPQEILYRQQVLQDCVEQPAIVREIYSLAVEALEGGRKVFRSLFLSDPEAILHGAVSVLELFVEQLRRLRRIGDEHSRAFRSPGFAVFFGMLERELADEYFQRVEEHLARLRFRGGVLISARLGRGNKGTRYVLRRPHRPTPGWRQWIPFIGRSSYAVVIAAGDDNGSRAMSELRGRGIDLAANAVAQSADHIRSFFAMLRAELGFYIGCLNLRSRLAEKGEPVCYPAPWAPGRPVLSARELYDVGLSLRLPTRAVGNDVNADDKTLLVITGANQGGKSTFLRSLGLAQLMMQSGMFVGAQEFRSNVCEALFTHYKREEDPAMKSGKLDEELGRMSQIADRATPNCLVLFNESFSTTNEREGAEIASSIIRALLEAGIKVFFVTHSFELAHGFHLEGRDRALFLRAERQADGRRTFRLVEGEPWPTSYGEDLYRRIFGEVLDVTPAALRG